MGWCSHQKNRKRFVSEDSRIILQLVAALGILTEVKQKIYF